MADNRETKKCCCRQEVQEQSLAMAIVKDHNRAAKKWFIITMALLVCWLGTIGLFVWYLSQYDFIIEEYTVEITEARGGEVSALTQIEY